MPAWREDAGLADLRLRSVRSGGHVRPGCVFCPSVAIGRPLWRTGNPARRRAAAASPDFVFAVGHMERFDASHTHAADILELHGVGVWPAGGAAIKVIASDTLGSNFNQLAVQKTRVPPALMWCMMHSMSRSQHMNTLHRLSAGGSSAGLVKDCFPERSVCSTWCWCLVARCCITCVDLAKCWLWRGRLLHAGRAGGVCAGGSQRRSLRTPSFDPGQPWHVCANIMRLVTPT